MATYEEEIDLMRRVIENATKAPYIQELNALAKKAGIPTWLFMATCSERHNKNKTNGFGYIPPAKLPNTIRELSPNAWANWMQHLMDKWNFEFCKYPDKSYEYVTGCDAITRRPITNQKLLRDYAWDDFESEGQMYLVRRTVEAFIKWYPIK